MNKILALNKPLEVDLPLNKPNQARYNYDYNQTFTNHILALNKP